MVIEDASKPFVKRCPESPIAVISSSSNERLILTALVQLERSTALTGRTTPWRRYTDTVYSSSFLVVGFGATGAA